MTLEEIDKKIMHLQKQRKEELRSERNADLALVKQVCKTHGFTARMLKGFLSEGRSRKANRAA